MTEKCHWSYGRDRSVPAQEQSSLVFQCSLHCRPLGFHLLLSTAIAPEAPEVQTTSFFGVIQNKIERLWRISDTKNVYSLFSPVALRYSIDLTVVDCRHDDKSGTQQYQYQIGRQCILCYHSIGSKDVPFASEVEIAYASHSRSPKRLKLSFLSRSSIHQQPHNFASCRLLSQLFDKTTRI